MYEILYDTLNTATVSEGIQVKDKNGTVLGKSPIAGKSAITQVAISRIITPLPAVFLPGVVTSFLTARFSALRHARVQTPLHLGVIALCLQIGLPTAIAMFPQTASMYGLEFYFLFNSIQLFFFLSYFYFEQQGLFLNWNLIFKILNMLMVLQLKKCFSIK